MWRHMTGGLTILVVSADPARRDAAAMVALAAAALGERVQVFHHADAVRLLAHADAQGAHLVSEMLAAGIRLIACQTGLAANEMSFETLADGCESGGLVSVLADAREDRLLSF